MECVVPLGCTNKATLGVKLLSATVSAWQVNCGCLCTSMNTQWLLFCSNIRKNPPTAPHPLLPAHPLYTESMILVRPPEKCLKFQLHWLASYNSNKILAIRLLYLYSESGVHALKHRVVTAS